jgi:signal transduction histidine kinase
VVVLLGELIPTRGGTASGYQLVFRAASSGAVVGIILLLLAQFRLRLTIAADRERAAAERLRELDAMKTTFLHAVSHDLRSPLTSIMGSAGTLERYDLPPEQRRALLGGILHGADKLRRLLDDLLDLDRFDEGRLTLDFETLDVSELVRSAIAATDLPEEREVTIDAEPVEVAVDGPKVERIVENLLLNACRHTGPDIPIWVRVRRREGGVLLIVEDAGTGVPSELRASIFEPFRRGPGADQMSGSGIGLSLVSRFAELHHGRAWVQERAGGGASFRVFLPGAAGREVRPTSEAISS